MTLDGYEISLALMWQHQLPTEITIEFYTRQQWRDSIKVCLKKWVFLDTKARNSSICRSRD